MYEWVTSIHYRNLIDQVRVETTSREYGNTKYKVVRKHDSHALKAMEHVWNIQDINLTDI